MRKENEPITIICLGEDITATHDVIVHSRIHNTGTKFVDVDNSDLILDEKIECFSLSITHKRWIGTTGMASYIVELVQKPKKDYLKCCKSCGSIRLTQLIAPYEHISECQDCKFFNT